MPEQLFFGVLTTEEVWLRQNAPEFLQRMRTQQREHLVRDGDQPKVAAFNAHVARTDTAWEQHKDAIPTIKLWSDPMPRNTPGNADQETREGMRANEIIATRLHTKPSLPVTTAPQQKPQLKQNL